MSNSVALAIQVIGVLVLFAGVALFAYGSTAPCPCSLCSPKPESPTQQQEAQP